MRKILLILFVISTTSFGQIDSFNKKDTQKIVNIQNDTLGEAKVKTTNRESLKTYDKDNSLNNANWLIISGFIGLLGTSLTWLYNEWQKRISKLISEKEKRYEKLISLIRSFGSGSGDVEKANEFIIEFQLCWMYCPDIIIEKGNKFIESMRAGIALEQKEKDIAKGEFILEIRRDLILTSKVFKFFYNKKTLTNLEANDFKDVYYTN
jgi:hypothetical protein